MKIAGKLLIALAAVVIIAGAAAKVFQRDIGFALAERFADQRAGRDVTVGMADGLHVILCGSGSPLPDRTRAGPCTVIIAGKRLFVVDAGEGGARNMAAMGLPMGRIDRIFLTHFHSDHIDGLGPMMLLRWTGASATAPLPVAGPDGVQAVVAGFDAAYRADNGYRTAHHGALIVPPSGAGAVAVPFAQPVDGQAVVVFAQGGLTVRAFRVNHAPVSPAVGYRFDYKGRSVTVSGDTAFSPSLVKAAHGTDVLVHEALQPKLVALLTKGLDAHGARNTAQITRDIVDYHATPEQAADAARLAGAGELVLNHLVPPLPSRYIYPAFLGDAQAHYAGRITVGEDGLMWSLPAGSKAIERKRLL